MCAKHKGGLEDYKTWLVQRQEKLWKVSSETADDRQPVNLDPGSSGRLSRAGDMQFQALARETDRRRQAELKRIESALTRLSEGEFGYCVICGEPIALERLTMDPAVATCIDCAPKIS